MRLTLPLPPTANLYWRTIRSGKGCRTLVSEAGRAYKDRAELLGKAQCREKLLGPVRVDLIIYFPNRCGDLDNRIKPTLDALQGVAIKNDSQVVALSARRMIDKENPRVEVEITES